MSETEEAMEAVSQARHQVDRFLAPIKVDSYDAPYRDSLILTAHILDTHKSRLEGLERAATLLAPLRASLFAVSSNVSDVWGPETAAELEALLPPRPGTKPQIKGTQKSTQQHVSLTAAPLPEAETAPQLLPPHFSSWLKVAPDPHFAATAQQQQSAFVEQQRSRTRAVAAKLAAAAAIEEAATTSGDDATATAVDENSDDVAVAPPLVSTARWARIRTVVWEAAATSPAVGLGFGERKVAVRDALQAQFYPPPPPPPVEPELENSSPESSTLESAPTPEGVSDGGGADGGMSKPSSEEAATKNEGGKSGSSSSSVEGGEGNSSTIDASNLNLANRVAQLELLANRHHHRLTTELPPLKQEVGHLRQASAQLRGRVTKLERENQRLKDWVAAYPALYEAQIRRTVREEPWFLETVEEYARATIEASGLPIRMQTQEQASQQVGARLARTETRSVDAAVSQVLGMMLRAGYLRPGRSTHDPDLQFEANIVSPAAALEATQAEISADPANALEPPSEKEGEATTTGEAAATAAATDGAATAESEGIGGEKESEKHHPAAFAVSTKVTFSTPVNLREVEASVSSVRDDMETCTAAVEECDANVKTCVTHEELDRALDLESEEALADPKGNPLLRMKGNLEASLAAAVAAADTRTSEQLVASSAAAKKELNEVNDRISTALAAQSRALQATNDRTSSGEEKQSEFDAKIAALTATMNNLPDPAPQIEALNAQGFDLLAANGKLAAQLATAVSESDTIRTNLSHLTHEFKHAGYCKAADLMDAEDRLKKTIDTCLDNIGVLGDATEDMRSLVKRGATMAQVAAFVEKAISEAASKLLPPDDTAMATTMRCLGCNQPYRNMHGSKADLVAHSSLPGLPEGPSSTTPETRKVYRDQWGVLLATYEHTNAEMEKRRKAASSASAHSGSGGSLVLPAATGRSGPLPPQQGGNASTTSSTRSTTRGGGLKPLGQVHVPHVPVHSGRNKLPLAATPQQLSANNNNSQQPQSQGLATGSATPGERASSAAQRAELDDRSRQREAEAAQQYLSGDPTTEPTEDAIGAAPASPLDPFFPKRRSSKEGPEPAPPDKIFDVSLMSEAEATAMPSGSLASSKGAPL